MKKGSTVELYRIANVSERERVKRDIQGCNAEATMTGR
jgi:hypothetical protein